MNAAAAQGSALPKPLTALIANGAPSAARIERFLSKHTFPMVDPQGVTFVYRGEADAVTLRLWVFGLPTAQSLTRVGDGPLWYLRIELPARSRIEYKFEVQGGPDAGWIRDPLNPVTATDPFGANSVCQAHGYRAPDWTRPQSGARAGSLRTVSVPSAAFGGHREMQIYLPARYRKRRRYPLLIAHDGYDFLRYADLKVVLDNLIERMEIAPMIVALTQSPDRLREYPGDPRHAQFLSEDLLPWLNRRLPLDDRPQARTLMGASFGGVASLYTAWRYPGVFGNLLLQSGSFAFSEVGPHTRGAAFDPVVGFMNQFRRKPGDLCERMYISCGIYESLIHENRALVALMQDAKIDIRYREVRDGHNWDNWRDRLQDALSWLHPGELWMIYE